MGKCIYKLTNVELPYSRALYKSACGFLYARTNGKDNKPIEGEQCMKCHKPITLIEADKIEEELEDLTFTVDEMEQCFKAGCDFIRDMFNNPSNSEYVNLIILQKKQKSFEDNDNGG